MGLEDKVAIPWMEQFTRNAHPDTVVWRQDDRIHDRFYWLAGDPTLAKAGDDIVARREGATFTLQTSCPLAVTLLLDDALFDLDTPMTVTGQDGQPLFAGGAIRTIGTLHQTLDGRGQLQLMAAARVEIPAATSTTR